MDQQQLRTLVFEKTGVKIDIDDPVFALVALNEAVLAEAVERHVALIDRASEAMAARLGAPVGSAQPVLPLVTTGVQAGAAAPAAEATITYDAAAVALAAAAAVLGAALALGGQALWFKPAPLPAPVIQARQLSAEQSAALRQAEKLDKIVQKLDSKTRAAIRAEMQKP
ncbi:hypothetical protein [Massilia sp. PWRC2]|uniref:hypothetical protein n=1 Tax=Massilia sp. PWRC2 TaxID=2804626 RepID=UPI003CE68068